MSKSKVAVATNDLIVEAVEAMKRSQFKATAIKVELEAQLNRGYDHEGGGRECEECLGNWEGEACDQCQGNGNVFCDSCSGGGRRSGGNCSICEGRGRFTCSECDGAGYYPDCQHCDEGIMQDEDSGYDATNYSDTASCHDFIMERLSHSGLAVMDDDRQRFGHGLETNWHVNGPLKYAEFYNDGSVDSEFTFTLSLEDPRSVLLLPKFIEAFKALAEAVGNGINVQGAGMHMALLNDPTCIYPGTRNNGDMGRFHNFSKSMRLLLPALYFLGSSDEFSRGLSYRRPEIGQDTHRSAIDYRNGALEFRVFNTCYDNPEAILDNVVVMSNAIKFWRTNYKPHNLRKICPEVRFGVDLNNKLERFYVTTQHVDLLNTGLRILKPCYYTIGELKQQRKFTVNKTVCKNREKKLRMDAEIEYKEYEDRFSWVVELEHAREVANRLQTITRISPTERATLNRDEEMARIEQEAATTVSEFAAREKTSLPRYVEDKLRVFREQSVGQYTLREEN